MLYLFDITGEWVRVEITTCEANARRPNIIPELYGERVFIRAYIGDDTCDLKSPIDRIIGHGVLT